MTMHFGPCHFTARRTRHLRNKTYSILVAKDFTGETTVSPPKKTESVEMPLLNLRSLNKALRGPYCFGGGIGGVPLDSQDVHWVVTLSGNRHQQHYDKFRFSDSKAKPLCATIIGAWGDNWGQPKLYTTSFLSKQACYYNTMLMLLHLSLSS